MTQKQNYVCLPTFIKHQQENPSGKISVKGAPPRLEIGQDLNYISET